MFEVRIHGRGGQGVVTAAELLSVEREDWPETERPEREEAIDAYLAEHPELVVGAAVEVM